MPDTDLLGMNAEMQRHLKKIYSLAKMMLVFLICFFASRLEHLLKLIFLRTEAWAGWEGENPQRHGNCPNGLLKCALVRVQVTLNRAFYAAVKRGRISYPEDLGSPPPGASATSCVNVDQSQDHHLLFTSDHITLSRLKSLQSYLVSLG